MITLYNFVRSLALLAALALYCNCWAYSDIYTCKDSNGHVITADRPIPECSDKTVKVYKPNGVMVNEISGTISSQQRATQDSDAAKQRQKEDDLKNEQRYLAAHYRNVDAIDTARAQAIGAIQARIDAEKHGQQEAQVSLDQDQKSLAATPPAQSAKIHLLKVDIDQLGQFIADSNRQIDIYQKQQDQLNRQFDQTRQRYLQIFPPASH